MYRLTTATMHFNMVALRATQILFLLTICKAATAAMWLFAVLLGITLPVHGEEQCSWGIYGENCDRACPFNCYPDPRRNLRHCQKYTGICSEGCVRGYHGDQCNISCSGGCLNETCNIGDGHCTLGCKETYIGDFCNETSDLPVHEQCSWGIYGENCDKTCPSNCYPDQRKNLIHCQKDTGKCSEGCVRGYHGDQCNISCSGGCLKETCNPGNGHCTLGCKQTYKGGFCNETLETVVTTHTTLPTTEASPVEPAADLVVIIVPIVVIILCLVIVAVVVCMVRKRRRRREANIESRFQEEVPLMDQNRAETANPLGPNTNNTRALFVETESFEKVREMLEKFHHVTISGAPGEGKTSMALMLGAEYRKQGYELVLVEDLDNVELSDWQGDGKDVCLIFDDIFQKAGLYVDVPRLTHIFCMSCICTSHNVRTGLKEDMRVTIRSLGRKEGETISQTCFSYSPQNPPS
ncbi:uncharacterized protein LOC124264517 [Haliotis rubra]|uniref:uncharacterized protein LOC124264517 n=1 Tax=Haliotis rubra TaxID=36100 RepID=UPI001EE50846|nr:uncharacterized protein LOC124264517 [Haliotis rubra]